MRKRLLYLLFTLSLAAPLFAQTGGPEGNSLEPTVCFKTETGLNVTEVAVEVTGYGNNLPSFTIVIPPGNNSCVGPFNSIPLASTTIITPAKSDNPLNGVSTFDLVLISRHILGIQPLTSPYKIIAADANKSNSVSTFDIVELRKLILGIYTKLPNNQSWRFVKNSYVFPNLQNPFQAVFPETITIQEVPATPSTVFIAIKVGDVNGSAISSTLMATESRSAQALSISDQILEAGAVVDVPVYSKETVQWLGFQAGINYNEDLLQLELIKAGDLPALDVDNFMETAGSVRCSWSVPVEQTIAPNTPLFTMRLRAKQALRLSDVLQLDDNQLLPEAYDNVSPLPLTLAFSSEKLTNGEAFAVLGVQPNPTNSSAVLNLSMEQAAEVQLELYDALGRLCYQNNQQLEVGQNILDLPANAMPVAGMYTWRVVANGVEKTGKLIRQ